MWKTTKPSGQEEASLDADAPITPKSEKGIPSRTVRWEKKIVDKPEEFIDHADLER
jgi:hypothetical protein